MDLDDFPDGVIIAGPDGAVEYVNHRVRNMARAEGDEMIGMHLREAVPFDDLNGNSWYDSTRRTTGIATRTRISEQSWWSPKGSEYLITASLVRDKPGGPVQQVVVSIRNARVRNQRDRERSDLVATVAHELRSPLTGIKGFTSTLLTKWDKFSEEQRQFMLETVDADADRLSRLITELLDAARIDAGRLTLKRGPVKLDEVVRHVLRNVSGGSTAPFEVSIGEGPRPDLGRQRPHVPGRDQPRRERAAPRLRPQAGVGRERPGVRRSTASSCTSIDQGPGIPEEMRQRVFSRFWRSGPGAGSGLGMYIVRGIVLEHGGQVEITDAEGGGADISAWFPINEPDAMTD